MTRQEYLDKIYFYVKPILMLKMKCSDDSEILTKYKEYLVDTYSDIIDNDKAYKLFLEIEMDYWKDKSSGEIDSILNPDYNYMLLENISHQALDCCIQKNRDGKLISKEEYDDFKKKMLDLASKVKDCNKISAKVLLSEGLLDLDNAMGLSEYSSVRSSYVISMNDDNSKGKAKN